MNLRLLRQGRAPGAANMEADERLAAAVLRGDSGPALRLYGWDPPAVSVGHHQSMDEFDFTLLRGAGVDIVRRPTGGRAILHWHELTYCAVVPDDFAPPRDLYRMINSALLAGVRRMGIDAVLGGSDAGLPRHSATAAGIPCFSFSVRSEIQVGGRKIVGSAQRRYHGAILQHGSFLLGREHRRLPDFLRGDIPGLREGAGAGLDSRTTEAETVLGRRVPFDEAADAIGEEFTRYFRNHDFTPADAGRRVIPETSPAVD